MSKPIVTRGTKNRLNRPVRVRPPTDNLPFPENKKPIVEPEINRVPANKHLIADTEALRPEWVKGFGGLTKTLRDFIIKEEAPILVAAISAEAEATEMLAALLSTHNVNLKEITDPLTDVLKEAVALKCLAVVSTSMNLTRSEQRMLHYLYLSRAVGAKGPPSETLLLELLKVLDVPREK